MQSQFFEPRQIRCSIMILIISSFSVACRQNESDRVILASYQNGQRNLDDLNLYTNGTSRSAVFSESDILTRLGEIAANTDNKRAARFYQTAIDKDTNLLEAFYGLAITQAGRQNLSKTAYEWVRIDVSNALPHYAISLDLIKRGDYQVAYEEIVKGNSLTNVAHRPLFTKILRKLERLPLKFEEIGRRDAYFRETGFAARLIGAAATIIENRDKIATTNKSDVFWEVATMGNRFAVSVPPSIENYLHGLTITSMSLTKMLQSKTQLSELEYEHVKTIQADCANSVKLLSISSLSSAGSQRDQVEFAEVFLTEFEKRKTNVFALPRPQ